MKQMIWPQNTMSSETEDKNGDKNQKDGDEKKRTEPITGRQTVT